MRMPPPLCVVRVRLVLSKSTALCGITDESRVISESTVDGPASSANRPSATSSADGIARNPQ